MKWGGRGREIVPQEVILCASIQQLAQQLYIIIHIQYNYSFACYLVRHW